MAIALVVTSSAQARTLLEPPATVPYATVAGDTLYELAQRYLTDARDWHKLARLNHVVSPQRLRPGTMLRIPVALLRRDPTPVSVVAMSGPVTTQARSRSTSGAAAAPAVPLLPGRTLGENDAISTGASGFATVELADGSYVTLTPHSSIAFATLRKTVLTGANERVIELRQGEVANEVTHAKRPDDRFEVHTPSIVAGVRGTRFRVSAAPSMTAVEVLDGKVAVAAAADAASRKPEPQPAASQFVTAGEGSATPAGGAVGAPQPLLPAPELVHPGKPQDGRTVAFTLERAPGASGYRVQIARDADLLDLIRDARVQAPTADFADVPDGTYFVRVSAIDASGLEGLPRVYAFERRENEVSATAAPRAGTRDYRFLWHTSRSNATTRFRLVLSHRQDLSAPLVDAVDLTGNSLVVSDLPAGDYYWCVVAEQYDGGRFYQSTGPVHAFTLAD